MRLLPGQTRSPQLANAVRIAELLSRLAGMARIAPKTAVYLHEYETLVDKALAVGGLGYVLKTRVHTDLPEAVQEALEGRCYVSSPLRR